jgi:hypothetical protein
MSSISDPRSRLLDLLKSPQDRLADLRRRTVHDRFRDWMRTAHVRAYLLVLAGDFDEDLFLRQQSLFPLPVPDGTGSHEGQPIGKSHSRTS